MPRVVMNDLSRAVRHQRADLDRVTAEVLDSGWFVMGPHHKAFEAEFAAYLGVATALGVGNGTDALELALRTCRADGRNTVVTAANAGGYTMFAAHAAGFDVAWCDIDEATLLLDPNALPAVLDANPATCAVVVTHLYGRAADVAPIREICHSRGIAVVEDCAESVGARTAEGLTGSLGDLSCFSFYPTKNLGALGDGGAISGRNAELLEKARYLRQYGWTTRYVAEHREGRNSRLDELQAAYLRVRLPLLDDANARRRQIISRYVAAAPASIRVMPADGAWHVGHLCIAVTDDAAALREHLDRQDVSSDVHFPIPDDAQPFRAGLAPADLPVTHSLVGRIVTLPCFPELTDAEIDQVCDALSSF